MWDEDNGRDISYQQICLRWDTQCYDNQHILFLRTKEAIQKEFDEAVNRVDGRIKGFLGDVIQKEVSS